MARLQSTHAVRCDLHESISKGHGARAAVFLSAGPGISPFSNSDLHLAHARLLPLQDAIAKGHSYVVLTCTPPRPRYRLLARAHSREMAAASLPARSRAGVIVSLTPFFFMMILKVWASWRSISLTHVRMAGVSHVVLSISTPMAPDNICPMNTQTVSTIICR